MGRRIVGNYINPLSRLLIGPRLRPPRLADIARRLGEIDWSADVAPDHRDLLVFFHADTLAQIVALLGATCSSARRRHRSTPSTTGSGWWPSTEATATTRSTADPAPTRSATPERSSTAETAPGIDAFNGGSGDDLFFQSADPTAVNADTINGDGHTAGDTVEYRSRTTP